MDKRLEMSQALRKDVENLLRTEGTTRIDWMDLSVQTMMSMTCVGSILPLSMWIYRKTLPWDSFKRTEVIRSKNTSETPTLKVSMYGKNPTKAPVIWIWENDTPTSSPFLELPRITSNKVGELKKVLGHTRGGACIERRVISEEDIESYRNWLNLS